MNTTENNKIIAEFIKCEKINSVLYSFKNLDYRGQVWFNESELRFHLDWNWLIKVVEKIKEISLLGSMGSSLNVQRIEIFKTITIFSEIQTVYNACSEFIKWYNEQK